MQKVIEKNILYIAWIQTLAATLGSLYYSEIKNYTPCTLCWYQRILMYPLVFIIAVGILRRDKRNLPYYVLPLCVTGWFIALYHVLLQKGILPEAIAPCSIGASCLTKYTGYFGFITIPVMSLAAFTVINLCMYIYLKANKRT